MTDKFVKYQHLEKFGTTEVEGINLGECYVFPKLDGSNGSIWKMENGQIRAGSRNRCLSLDNDHAGFYARVLEDEKIKLFLNAFPNIRLYGEIMIPHTIKTYREDVWRTFQIFDVVDESGSYPKYLNYEEYQPMLEQYGLDYITPICKVKNPTEPFLIESLKRNTFLIQDGHGIGEGVVIKNYNFVNKYGRVTWAKIVSNEFKGNAVKRQVPELKVTDSVESKIVEKFVGVDLINKVYAKIEVENDGWSSKFISRLIETVYYDLIREEMWEIIKSYKNPKIDFKNLKALVVIKIKIVKPGLFQ